MKANNNSEQVLIQLCQLAKANLKGADLKGYDDILKANKNSVQILNLLVELSKSGTKGGDVAGCISALKLRGGNPQDLFKQEDVFLACSYVKAGCSVAEIHTMFELLTGQHKGKELQNIFNATPDLRNKPKEITSWINTNP